MINASVVSTRFFTTRNSQYVLREERYANGIINFSLIKLESWWRVLTKRNLSTYSGKNYNMDENDRVCLFRDSRVVRSTSPLTKRGVTLSMRIAWWIRTKISEED